MLSLPAARPVPSYADFTTTRGSVQEQVLDGDRARAQSRAQGTAKTMATAEIAGRSRVRT